jgi:hypothetical protein
VQVSEPAANGRRFLYLRIAELGSQVTKVRDPDHSSLLWKRLRISYPYIAQKRERLFHA